MRLGEHVLDYDVRLKFAYLKLPAGILQCYKGVFLPVQALAAVVCLALPPVVEEEVVQQSTSCRRPVVEAKSLCNGIGDIGNPDDVVIDVVGMMVEALEFGKLLVAEDIVYKQDELLAFRPGKEEGDPLPSGHGAVEMVGCQEVDKGEYQKEYGGRARKESTGKCKVVGKEKQYK